MAKLDKKTRQRLLNSGSHIIHHGDDIYLTLTTFSERHNISQGTISRYKKLCTRNIPSDVLIILSERHNISPRTISRHKKLYIRYIPCEVINNG